MVEINPLQDKKVEMVFNYHPILGLIYYIK